MKIPWKKENIDSLFFAVSPVITMMTSATQVVNRCRKKNSLVAKRKKKTNF